MRLPAVYFGKEEYQMRKCSLFVLCVLFALAALGCGRDTADSVPTLKDTYYAEGKYDAISTPYLYLHEDNTFMMGLGAVYSFAEFGTYEIFNGDLVVTSQSSVYTFRIQDSETLVLIDTGDSLALNIPKNTRFLFQEELK